MEQQPRRPNRILETERLFLREMNEEDMERVAQSVFPTPQQTAATSQWARRSQTWLRGFWNSLYPGRL